MTPDHQDAGVMTKRGAEGAPSGLPQWFPPWARQLAELYFSGTTAAFVLHGNTYDYVQVAEDGGAPYAGLTEFLAEQLFGRWQVVLQYDLGRGLRVAAGRDEQRLKAMVTLANKKVGDLSALSKEPSATFALLDRFVRGNIMAQESDRLSLAFILDQASYIFPSGEPGRLSAQASSQLVTMLNWAMSPHVKRLNMAFVLVDERLSDVSERLTGNSHVATIEVPLPNQSDRERFINATVTPQALSTFSDFDAAHLATLTGGIPLTDVNVLVQTAREGGRRLDAEVFRASKKRLIERQCRGLLEFIEPKWTLGTVVGHEAAKARLREDAALLKRGALESLPMGYLLCGPVGTGKSFLAQCVSGEIGVPCVMLKNFRSKYVGETEGNLERVLSLLRAMGPVVVVVDEADAALGSREQDGDSGTSSRVFGMIASQMGDTRYRGRIVWMLHSAARPPANRPQAAGTCRSAHPALLPDRRERNPPDVRHPREEAGVAAFLGRPAGDSTARSSVGCGHRGYGRPGLAQGLVGRPGPHHARGDRRSGRPVHAVHAGARAGAPGNSGHRRVHGSTVPAA
jgi:hypothetical protein